MIEVMQYNPTHFKIDSKRRCLEIAREISFASIIYLQEEKLEVSHNPVFVDITNNKIQGHFAKANPASTCIHNQEILVTFQGEHDLIRPHWYESEGRVPTWNYIAIHVRGKALTFDNPEKLSHLLRTMGELYHIQDLVITPAKLNSIIGFQLEISEVIGKAKLAQHLPKNEIENVSQNLEQIGNKNLAKLMREFAP